METAERNKKILSYALYAIAAVYFIFISFHVLAKPHKYFGDFKIYYYAAQAHQQGLNPYSLKNLGKFSGREMYNPFRYPPHVLYLFAPITGISSDNAAVLWTLLKLALFAALVLMWIKLLGISGDYSVFILFCLLAFGRTFYLDIKSGNVSIIEQFLIWYGIWFFLKKQYLLFSAMIIAAASFKLLPILLLFAYLVRGGRKETVYCAISFALFAALAALSWFAWPDLCVKFLQSAGGVDERNGVNPCALALIRDLFSFAGPYAANAVYALLAVAVTSLFIFTLRNKNETNEKFYIFFFIILYAVTAPRFKDYSYLMLIAPAWYMLEKTFRGWPLYAVLLAFTAKIFFPLGGIISGYYFYFLVIVLFVMYYRQAIKPQAETLSI